MGSASSDSDSNSDSFTEVGATRVAKANKKKDASSTLRCARYSPTPTTSRTCHQV